MRIENKKHIRSVDDFGISTLANRRILECAEMGKIDRVAVMIGGAVSEEERQRLLRCGVAIDLHLDMGTFPLNAEKHLSSNVGVRIAHFLAGVFSGKYSSGKVARGWEDQIIKFRSVYGRYPDGLNSHEHTHFFPFLTPIIFRLARTYAIPYVRFGMRASTERALVARILDILRFVSLKKVARYNIPTSEVLISADWLPGFDIRNARRREIAQERVEIIFHPERDTEWEYLIQQER